MTAAKQSRAETIAYMPPEQLENLIGERTDFDPNRADVYSLGVVLWELLFGSRPHQQSEDELTGSGKTRLQEMVCIRQSDIDCECTDHIGLVTVLRRAMSANPQDRYPSAAAMATALEGLCQLYQVRQQVPNQKLQDFVRRHLFWVILAGGMLPNFAASVLQSSYNAIYISNDAEVFKKAFLAYNIVVYPACMGWLAWNLYRFTSVYRRVQSCELIGRARMRRLRRRLLHLPRAFMIASAVGWFPGIVLYPLLLGFFGEAQSASGWGHYAISFAISGLIATTYSYAIVLFLAIYFGYQECWQTAAHYRRRVRYELSGLRRRINWLSVVAGILPLAAAVLLLALGMPPMHKIDAEQAKRMHDLHQLVIALVVAGGIGLYIVELATDRVTKLLRVITLSD